MPRDIIVVIESAGNIPNPACFEVLGLAINLAPSRLVVVALGDDLDSIEEHFRCSEIHELVKIEHSCLENYTSDAYIVALATLIKDRRPNLVLFAHTYQTRDYASALAYEFGTSLVVDGLSVKEDERGWLVERQLFQGRAIGQYRIQGDCIAFVSLQVGTNTYDSLKQTSAVPEITYCTVDFGSIGVPRIQHTNFLSLSDNSVALSDADVVVAVGRGIKGPENIELAQRLADCFGGSLAASRPVCDEGWLPHNCQIGSSGQTVTPKLYIALGISGAAQHLVGMKNAQTIIAINKDANAPIFKVADVAIIGDLFEVIPKLLTALEVDDKQVQNL